MGRSPDAPESEADAVRARYARRAPLDWRYHRLNPAALLASQERERAIARMFLAQGWRELRGRRLLEVGCGSGDNLLEMLRLGFAPEHLGGIELLDERYAAARSRLPGALALIHGDALHAGIAEQSQDVVLQSTVFSSLLDPAFQQHLADAMWRWLKPGGAVLWYDFTLDNPRNADVRGVPLARVRTLFPRGRIAARRITLAPPLARAAVRVHPALYTALNVLAPLRTHLLAWIEKPTE
jgi:SAM-dependent methyltransferase